MAVSCRQYYPCPLTITVTEDDDGKDGGVCIIFYSNVLCLNVFYFCFYAEVNGSERMRQWGREVNGSEGLELGMVRSLSLRSYTCLPTYVVI